MLQPTHSPTGPTPVTTPTIPARTVLAGIAVLRGRTGLPAVDLAAAVDFAADGRRVTLRAANVQELSAWYEALTPHGTAVGGQYEARPGGALTTRGGLSWVLSYGPIPGVPAVHLSVVTESGETESLPDTALVRAMCPWAVRTSTGRVAA
ncbi:hypothetical protein [Kitasatospora sp. NPDC056181]|uniref:hypothetical protein n=1 Tax=Kitasatospora sp. NPDC056181 TaxID=3345737 RepID=UPI0035DFEEFC